MLALGPHARPPEELAALVVAVDQLAAKDREGLTDAVRAARVLQLRRPVDRLEGHWLQKLAELDASGAVRTARALFGGPARHRQGPDRRGDLPGACRGAGRRHPRPGHLRLVVDPGGENDRAERRHARRGLWLSPTWEGMVAIDGLLEAEAGQSLLAALEPLARPQDAEDSRGGGRRQADALAELARQAVEGSAAPGWWGPAPADGGRGPGH